MVRYTRILDSSAGYSASSPYQSCLLEQCLRYLNGEKTFHQREVNLLIRAFEQSSCDYRKLFYYSLRSLRRRPRAVDENSELDRLWTVENDLTLIQARALLSRARQSLSSRGMLVMDSFRFINQSGSGRISCSEMYSALKYMNIDVRQAQVHMLIQQVDTNGDGWIDSEEFRSAFRDPNR